MNKALLTFYDNTQQLHILLCSALFFIVICMFIPPKMKMVRIGGSLLIISALAYILYGNFIETQLFSKKTQEDAQKNPSSNELDMKNNILASYVLCGFIMALILYIVYSMCY